jgi:hypothetical protein
MKSNKFILLMITAAFLNGFSSVNAQVDAKSKKARNHVQEANQELNEAHSDSARDYNIFKQKAEEQNVYNERKIALLKEKNKMASEEVRNDYQKKLQSIEKQNEKLKKQLAEASKTQTDLWTAYKREFNHDMRALTDAINDLATDNVK